MSHVTTAALFQGSLQATDEWLSELMHELGWTDRRKAYHGLRATLHALRDQVVVDECAQLSAQLPLLLRGVYWEGWNPTCGSWQQARPEDFLTSIHAAFKHDSEIDPEVVARAVFKVMTSHISAGEMDDIRGVVPKAVRQLMTPPLLDKAPGEAELAGSRSR